MRKCYAQSNILIRRFGKFSYETKCMLFRTYCSSLYCPHLWFNTTQNNMNKLRIAYNNSLRCLFKIPKRSSDSDIFVYLNIPAFDELLRKNIHSFIDRIKNCKSNLILGGIVGSSTQVFSNIWAWWCNTLFSYS